MSNYQTIGIYLPHNASCPRPATDQEKILIDLAAAIGEAFNIESLVSCKEEMFFWYEEGKQIVMTFNSQGHAPSYRGNTEAECLESAKRRLLAKYSELKNNYERCAEVVNDLKNFWSEGQKMWNTFHSRLVELDFKLDKELNSLTRMYSLKFAPTEDETQEKLRDVDGIFMNGINQKLIYDYSTSINYDDSAKLVKIYIEIQPVIHSQK